MKTVFYWSPCLNKVGTVKSTLNSAISLSKYSKEKYKVKIINTCGEWDEYLELFEKNNINVINFRFKLFSYLPKNGFISSRISYLIIILFSFFPLIKILKKEQPEFIIMHLITSLPIVLNNLLKFKTKFILRISGYPKLNFFRKILWKISSKNLFCVTCPTRDLIKDLKKEEIFIEDKIFYLQDAIINVQNFIKKNKENNNEFKSRIKQFSNYFLSVGRLTKQKNYSYLISEFANFLKYNKNEKLLIIGEGEEKKQLKKLIKKKDLTKNVFLIGQTYNVYPYMKNARALILSSLWEEVGFVIVEAAFSNLFVISSNCPNGPKEFLENGRAGYLFESNKKDNLTEKLLYFIQEEKNLQNLTIKAKKNSANYTPFRHYLSLQKILSNEN